MTNTLLNISFADGQSFIEACHILHDCMFLLDELSDDRGALTWRGRFLRPSHGALHMKEGLLRTRWCVNVFKTTLFLQGVQERSIVDKSNIGTYTFVDVIQQGKCYALRFIEGLLIEIEFANEPMGTISDDGLYEKKGYYTSFLGIECGPYFK